MDSGSESKRKSILPKPEIIEELPDEGMYSSYNGNNAASSSGSSLRSFLLGMGFSPSLVDRVIEEKGDNDADADMLLETLLGYSDARKSNSQSSDSLDSLFGDKDTTEVSTSIQPKEDPDEVHVVGDDEKRKSLLMMNFSMNAVNFALDKLGEDAPINELVDFIIAMQIAENIKKETDDMPNEDEGKNEDSSNETLFGTMEKTLRLLEMGFSETQVSLAIEKFGSDVPISELANFIFSDQFGPNYVKSEEYSDFTMSHSRFAEAGGSSVVGNTEENNRGKRPKEEHFGDFPYGVYFEENHNGKRTKQESIDDSCSLLGSSWVEEKISPNIASSSMPIAFNCAPSKIISKVAAKAPYFFYGNIANIPNECWKKISNFLYEIEPEFVNTESFSALNRNEGYVHNLPTSDRSHILHKSPMTIEDVMPHTKKWWPYWDSRKQLSCITSEIIGISDICDRLAKIVIDSGGLPSLEQQRYILNHCDTFNLVWVGRNKLATVDPEYLERILGLPLNHTEMVENNLLQRVESLKYCFQTDTLGYHLSVLKSMYPRGLTMLSVFDGVGGAAVTLQRLGISLNGLISVENSETNRKILKRWWISTGQTGELVQIQDIHSLTITKVESLFEKFGSIDFIICNPYALASNSSTTAATGFDLSLFYEFVRLVQRVRSTMERKR